MANLTKIFLQLDCNIIIKASGHKRGQTWQFKKKEIGTLVIFNKTCFKINFAKTLIERLDF